MANSPDITELKLPELKAMGEALGIPKARYMRKPELLEAIAGAGQPSSSSATSSDAPAAPERRRGRPARVQTDRTETVDTPRAESFQGPDATSSQGERSDRPERGPRPERMDRPERGERPDRGPRSDRGDRPERGERPDRGDRADRGPRSDRGDRPERGDRPDRGDRTDRGPRTERGDRPDRPDRTERQDRRHYEFEGLIPTEGVVEMMPDNFAFLRSSDYNYLNSPDDVYISVQQVKQFGLKTGDTVRGEVRPPREGEKFFPLTKVISINGREPDFIRDRVSFEHLTPLFPEEKFKNKVWE